MAALASPALIATLSLLLIIAAAAAAASSSSSPKSSLDRCALESFIGCFVGHSSSPSASSLLICTPNTAGYGAVLNSSVQNIRFLYSPTAEKPLLIVTPTAISHVQAAVVCGRKHGLRVRARSGGHDYEGMSYVSSDGGGPFVLVDLSNLRSVTVDAEHGTAWVQAGATLGELYYAIAAESRTTAFPAGVCPTVGVGGHFSGGGIGMISRKYGTSADRIEDAKVVDADGRLLDRESMGEDYFWAIRGGGAASFGVVVSFKVKLVTIPPIVTAFNVIKTLKHGATKLVSTWQLVGPNLDENLYMRVIAQAIDDDGDGDEEAKGSNRTIKAIFNSLYLGRCEQLIAVMERSFPELGFEAANCNEMSWLESVLFFANYAAGEPPEKLLDRSPASNSSFKAKSDFVEDPISERGLEKLWKFLMEAKDEPLTLIMDPFGGALSQVPESAIPFPHRKGNLYLIQYFMRWFETDLETTERHLSWMRKLHAMMTPYVSKNPRAAYVNYRDIDLGRSYDGSHEIYSKARVWGLKYFKNNSERLSHVKSKVDPHDFFRNEQSIPPLKLL